MYSKKKYSEQVKRLKTGIKSIKDYVGDMTDDIEPAAPASDSKSTEEEMQIGGSAPESLSGMAISSGENKSADPMSRRNPSRSLSHSSSVSDLQYKRRTLCLSQGRSDSQSDVDSLSLSESLSVSGKPTKSIYVEKPALTTTTEEEESQTEHDSLKRANSAKKRFKDYDFDKMLSTKKSEVEVIPSLPLPKEIAIPDLNIWKKKRKHRVILCLDGGGIRGLATAQFLLHLEQALGQPLHTVFDMICGSSTGAILAAVLGGLGKSAEDAYQLYTTRENLKGIFPTTSNWSLQGPKYGNGKGKTTVLKKYCGETKMNEAKTHLLIASYDISNQEPCIFTEQCDGITLVDAVNASSAAPTFFPPVEVSSGRWCIDGSIIASDLSVCAYAEAIQLWGRDQEVRILSVGTGTTSNASLDGEEAKKFGVIGWFTKGDLLGTLMSSSLVQKQAEVLLGDHFLRVNSPCTDYQVKPELDNLTKANLKQLQHMGQGWFKEFGATALDLITKGKIPA